MPLHVKVLIFQDNDDSDIKTLVTMAAIIIVNDWTYTEPLSCKVYSQKHLLCRQYWVGV